MRCPHCGEDATDRARYCPGCGARLDPAAGAAPPTRRVVTVLFADVTGSTGLAERFDPETMRGLMSRYFDRMRAVLEHHGGTVEKFVGDAVMAVFGLPRVHEDDALRAVRAASDMRGALERLNDDLEREHGVRLQARIGVNTGEVVAGEPGSATLVTGDPVNVAARLQQSAAPGEVLVGRQTRALVRAAARFDELPPMEVRGRSAGVVAYRLLDVDDVGHPVARNLETPLVGRTRERDALLGVYERCVEHRACHLVTVLGPAGMGKSRLVAELVARVGGEATVLRGACLPYGEGITYWALHDVVAQAIGLGPDDTGDAAVGRIAAEVVDPTVARAVAERVAAAIGLAGAPGTAEETAWAVRRLLESHATARPLVVVVDDLQWAEDALLDLLEHVVDWSNDVPLMLVCSARPELLDRRPTWGGGKLNATSFALEPLSEAESARLVGNLLGDDLPAAARTHITATARGNPLFLEETLRMLVEEGSVRREDGHWTVVGAGDIRIPPTIAALLAARIDQLDAVDRGLLECAAVCGEEFHLGAVAALAGIDVAQLRSRVAAMARRDLLRPTRSTLPGEEAFAFRHILIRDAAYAGMAKVRRADLHERFAGWLEPVTGARVAEYEEILGHHLERAHGLRTELGSHDDPSRTAERAAGLLARAGRRAVERGDLVAADKLLSRADALLTEDSPAALPLLLDLTTVRADLGAHQPAHDAADRCVRLARRTGDRRSELLARLEVVVCDARGEAATEIVDFGEVHALIDEARDWFTERGDDLGLSTVWFIAGYVELMLARWGLVDAAVVRALEHARRCSDRRSYSRALAFHVNAIYWGATPLDACIAEVERLLAEHDEPTRRATLVGLLGSCCARAGRREDALRLIDEAGRLAADLGTPLLMARYLGFNRGRILAATGDLEGAVQSFRESIDRFLALGDRGHAATIAGLLGETLIDLGRFEEAAEAARLCRENTPVLDVVAQWQWRILEATLSAPTDVEGALALADEAVRLVDSTDDIDFQGTVRMRRAAILERAGRLAEARADVEDALRRHQAKGAVVLAGRARERLAGMRDAV